MEIASGSAVWYHNGMEPLPIRWVLTRDPGGGWSRRPTSRRGLGTMPAEFVKRWPIEVTFEESRSQLGVETQRQWSDLAIVRETLCLMGLYSLVALLGEVLHPVSPVAIRAEATFSDMLAAVRRECWDSLDIRTSDRDPFFVVVPRPQFARLLNLVYLAH